jgi:hypothetical protein
MFKKNIYILMAVGLMFSSNVAQPGDYSPCINYNNYFVQEGT